MPKTAQTDHDLLIQIDTNIGYLMEKTDLTNKRIDAIENRINAVDSKMTLVSGQVNQIELIKVDSNSFKNLKEQVDKHLEESVKTKDYVFNWIETKDRDIRWAFWVIGGILSFLTITSNFFQVEIKHVIQRLFQ